MPKSLSDFPLPLGSACLDRLRVEFILSSSKQPSLVLQPGAGAPTPSWLKAWSAPNPPPPTPHGGTRRGWPERELFASPAEARVAGASPERPARRRTSPAQPGAARGAVAVRRPPLPEGQRGAPAPGRAAAGRPGGEMAFPD